MIERTYRKRAFDPPSICEIPGTVEPEPTPEPEPEPKEEFGYMLNSIVVVCSTILV